MLDSVDFTGSEKTASEYLSYRKELLLHPTLQRCD